MRKNIILTASNERHGDFLIRHWLPSILDNVNLRDIDIGVINYGLSSVQKNMLRTYPVTLFPGTFDGSVVNARFIDAAKILKQKPYTQVLFIDSGDIIIQDDISGQFYKNPRTFRVVAQDVNHLFFELHTFLNFHRFERELLWSKLQGKAVLNAGVIFAPVDRFIKLCEDFRSLYRKAKLHLSDQVIINYLLYKSDLTYLDKSYNYMVGALTEKYTIRDGVFYNASGNKVHIVHNPGRVNWNRSIAHFGYGENYNTVKPLNAMLRQFIFAITDNPTR